ncbi:MAG: glycosyltransferase [Melioribacteraceae bacterium]|nr:glycosyltransferase [Melioribacteraceae bacterium]MCF8266398.1 glycosyltransferase [Melioribacteraceae bacterium]MCF8413243.1 glycosyltransferase [Melioribacteraceae bacterium]MCF8432743.1 glycosyltransferase [Melioribacteraceae bacterium]
MRIAVFMTGIDYGGASKSLQLMLRSLRKFTNLEFYIFTQFTKAQEITAEIVEHSKLLKIVSFPMLMCNQAYQSKKKEYDSIVNGNYNSLTRLISDYKIDIIHINSTTLCYLNRHFKSEFPNVKIVSHLREVIQSPGKYKCGVYLTEQIRKYSDHIISISENEISSFGKIRNCSIIYNPHDFEELESLNLPERKTENETFRIGMMGAFNASKGHLNFLKAITRVKKETDKKILGVILGVRIRKNPLKKNLGYILNHGFGDDYYTKLDKFITKSKIRENVELLGPGYFINQFLNELDIYVRPSDSGDPWGRDIIEAMALKKPIVATGKSETYIQNGKTGYLVPERNSKKMAVKILELIENETVRTRFGEEGFLKVKSMCDVKNYGGKIYKIYSDLMESKPN